MLSIQLAVYGFMFYYVAPLSFFFNRFDIFLLFLNLTLLGMVLGLTVLANLTQEYFEMFLTMICSWFMCSNRSLRVVIEKNL